METLNHLLDFFQTFWGNSVLAVGALTLFWTSDDVFPKVLSKAGSSHLRTSWLLLMIYWYVPRLYFKPWAIKKKLVRSLWINEKIVNFPHYGNTERNIQYFCFDFENTS